MDIPSALEMQLMALLTSEEMPGREVAKQYSKEYRKSISYGTLYTTFRRLKEQGWVGVREDEDQDGRIRLFKITPSGKAALREGSAYYLQLGSLGLAH